MSVRLSCQTINGWSSSGGRFGLMTVHVETLLNCPLWSPSSCGDAPSSSPERGSCPFRARLCRQSPARRRIMSMVGVGPGVISENLILPLSRRRSLLPTPTCGGLLLLRGNSDGCVTNATACFALMSVRLQQEMRPVNNTHSSPGSSPLHLHLPGTSQRSHIRIPANLRVSLVIRPVPGMHPVGTSIGNTISHGSSTLFLGLRGTLGTTLRRSS
jgi:hypothetical protein